MPDMIIFVYFIQLYTTTTAAHTHNAITILAKYFILLREMGERDIKLFNRFFGILQEKYINQGSSQDSHFYGAIKYGYLSA